LFICFNFAYLFYFYLFIYLFIICLRHLFIWFYLLDFDELASTASERASERASGGFMSSGARR
jgi:hypothetical protein